MTFQFLDPHALLLFWGLPLLAALLVVHGQRRARKLRLFNQDSDAGLLWLLVTLARHTLLFVALALIIIALARPAWQQKPTKVKREGRDVVFMLDVSRSMLAEDLSPNRLERAKLAIMDCVERLQGDRVSLVAFAGSAKVRCPLTMDYGFFRQMLERLSTDMEVKGGTNIGDSLRLVQQEVFDNQVKAYKDIILITDGEDHESFPVNAAEAVGDEGIRLIVIGLGDERQGQPIPIIDEQGRRRNLTYEGKEVATKLDAATLAKIALATPGGRYLPVNTGAIDLGQVYLDLIAGDAKRQLAEETIENFDEKFQYFLGVALLLLIVEMLLLTTQNKGMARK
ncbi:MAG: VWA domain-containing protein [Proteobacteria bacterium]|nr:VWA domain-containing protein [Pseudomonadota bacterium]MBU1639745.1 VWA domain-containing protein [Pseudomonadota bacterium]